MSFSPTTSTSSSSGSSHPTRIEEDPPSLVLSTDGTLRSPARRCAALHHESGGSIEGADQMLNQAERRRVKMLALVESALALVDASCHEDGHHHHCHSNRREQEQQQAMRAGRNAAADAGSSNEEEDDCSSSSRTKALALSVAVARTAPQRLPHSSPDRGPIN
jgi:hypothetical protein